VYTGGVFDIATHDTTPAAPAPLEPLQRFLNLHRHEPGRDDDLPPTAEMVRTFLVERGLLDAKASFDASDLERALELHAVLHAKVRANTGGRLGRRAAAVLDDVARRAALRPRFDADRPALVADGEGVDAALGRLVAIAFHADLDGSWSSLKECSGRGCTSVFFDRTKNHSGRWCSMAVCGNRAKVRAWRERQRTEPT
jgi:predicted RNA-binding Zn ribbon-like protein